MAYGEKKRKHQKMEREFAKSIGDSKLGQARAEHGRPGGPMMGAASEARKKSSPKKQISTSEAFMRFVRKPPSSQADIRDWDAEMKKYRKSKGVKTTRPGRS